MKSLLHGARNLFLYACLATLISEVILLAYVTGAWNLDRGRWDQALDVARGAAEVGGGGKTSAPEPAPEQPSYEQILEARALKDRNLELREHQLQNGLAELRRDQDRLADDEKKFKNIQDHFETQLSALREKTTAAGLDDVRQTLESIDAKQAKQLLLDMLDKNEMDDVVSLLLPMSDKKRAKIIGEFSGPDELEKISEVLRRVRQGRPESQVTESVQKQLKAKGL